MARARRVRPDEQLSLVEHLDELRTRIIIVLAVLAVGITVCFWRSGDIYYFLTGPIDHRKLAVFSPIEGFLNSISISIYGGLLLTLPVASYQLYAYVIPAFAEEHHRSLRPMLMLIPGLFIAGVVFCWYLVIPPSLDFLLGWNTDQLNYVLRVRDYVQFVMLTLLALGIVFELPVVMLMLGRIGLVSSTQMRRHWRVTIVALAVVAMLLPGVDPITFIVEFIPLLLLYGLSYFLVRIVEPKREPEPEPSG